MGKNYRTFIRFIFSLLPKRSSTNVTSDVEFVLSVDTQQTKGKGNQIPFFWSYFIFPSCSTVWAKALKCLWFYLGTCLQCRPTQCLFSFPQIAQWSLFKKKKFFPLFFLLKDQQMILLIIIFKKNSLQSSALKPYF